MRVLHTPKNIASLISHTVRGLRETGVEARGLVISNHPIQSAEGIEVISIGGPKPFSRLASKLVWFVRLFSISRQVDLIHWYYGASSLPFGIDSKILQWLHKPGLIEWMGSDVRIPDIEAAENPYYAAAFRNGYENAAEESRQKSLLRQAGFARAGFASAADLALHAYISRDIFPRSYLLPRRLLVRDFAQTAMPVNPVPVVMHSPSAPVIKGTAFVLKAVENLQKKIRFEFKLVQDMPRNQAMQILAGADILIDQLVLGDYGMAALEAMAAGKPVICFIKPSLVEAYGPNLPIINATGDSLETSLASLLMDANRRRELGQQGHEYVLAHHDVAAVIPLLQGIYQDVLRQHH